MAIHMKTFHVREGMHWRWIPHTQTHSFTNCRTGGDSIEEDDGGGGGGGGEAEGNDDDVDDDDCCWPSVSITLQKSRKLLATAHHTNQPTNQSTTSIHPFQQPVIHSFCLLIIIAVAGWIPPRIAYIHIIQTPIPSGRHLPASSRYRTHFSISKRVIGHVSPFTRFFLFFLGGHEPHPSYFAVQRANSRVRQQRG